jgi:hypothetical protein
MPAKLTELITEQDKLEVIRDEIAGILAVESAGQQALATAADEDPRLWTLRVFTERSNPWSEFSETPDQLDAYPIINVLIENANVDLGASNVVEKQTYEAVFNIDCYGYGVSAELPNDAGHTPGDEAAAKDAQRAARLVRNILMAGAHTYLGLRGVVGRRMVTSITAFQPSIDGRQVQQVSAVRVVLAVKFIQHSQQVSGEPFESVYATCKRRETGEIYFAAQYGEASGDS